MKEQNEILYLKICNAILAALLLVSMLFNIRLYEYGQMQFELRQKEIKP